MDFCETHHDRSSPPVCRNYFHEKEFLYIPRFWTSQSTQPGDILVFPWQNNLVPGVESKTIQFADCQGCEYEYCSDDVLVGSFNYIFLVAPPGACKMIRDGKKLADGSPIPRYALKRDRHRRFPKDFQCGVDPYILNEITTLNYLQSLEDYQKDKVYIHFTELQQIFPCPSVGFLGGSDLCRLFPYYEPTLKSWRKQQDSFNLPMILIFDIIASLLNIGRLLEKYNILHLGITPANVFMQFSENKLYNLILGGFTHSSIVMEQEGKKPGKIDNLVYTGPLTESYGDTSVSITFPVKEDLFILRYNQKKTVNIETKNQNLDKFPSVFLNMINDELPTRVEYRLTSSTITGNEIQFRLILCDKIYGVSLLDPAIDHMLRNVELVDSNGSDINIEIHTRKRLAWKNMNRIMLANTIYFLMEGKDPPHSQTWKDLKELKAIWLPEEGKETKISEEEIKKKCRAHRRRLQQDSSQWFADFSGKSEDFSITFDLLSKVLSFVPEVPFERLLSDWIAKYRQTKTFQTDLKIRKKEAVYIMSGVQSILEKGHQIEQIRATYVQTQSQQKKRKDECVQLERIQRYSKIGSESEQKTEQIQNTLARDLYIMYSQTVTLFQHMKDRPWCVCIAQNLFLRLDKTNLQPYEVLLLIDEAGKQWSLWQIHLWEIACLFIAAKSMGLLFRPSDVMAFISGIIYSIVTSPQNKELRRDIKDEELKTLAANIKMYQSLMELVIPHESFILKNLSWSIQSENSNKLSVICPVPQFYEEIPETGWGSGSEQSALIDKIVSTIEETKAPYIIFDIRLLYPFPFSSYQLYSKGELEELLEDIAQTSNLIVSFIYKLAENHDIYYIDQSDNIFSLASTLLPPETTFLRMETENFPLSLRLPEKKSVSLLPSSILNTLYYFTGASRKGVEQEKKCGRLQRKPIPAPNPESNLPIPYLHYKTFQSILQEGTKDRDETQLKKAFFHPHILSLNLKPYFSLVFGLDRTCALDQQLDLLTLWTLFHGIELAYWSYEKYTWDIKGASPLHLFEEETKSKDVKLIVFNEAATNRSIEEFQPKLKTQMETFESLLPEASPDASIPHINDNKSLESGLITTDFVHHHLIEFYPIAKQKEIKGTIPVSEEEAFINVFSDPSVRLFHENNPFYIHVKMIQSFAEKYHPSKKPGMPYVFLSSYEAKKTFEQNDFPLNVHVVADGQFNLQALQQIRLEQLSNRIDYRNTFQDLQRYCRDLS